MKLMAYFIIPIYTILFTSGYNWFTTNFSIIGNVDKRMAFLIWGFLIGGYFFKFDRRIKALISLGRPCSRLIPTSLVLLLSAITTPYLPEEMPFKSFLHILLALAATLLLLLFLLMLVWRQYQKFPDLYRHFIVELIMIIAFSLLLLAIAGIISSALELFITITTVTMAERLTDQIRKQQSARLS